MALDLSFEDAQGQCTTDGATTWQAVFIFALMWGIIVAASCALHMHLRRALALCCMLQCTRRTEGVECVLVVCAVPCRRCTVAAGAWLASLLLQP